MNNFWELLTEAFRKLNELLLYIANDTTLVNDTLDAFSEWVSETNATVLPMISEWIHTIAEFYGGV